ncbi:unnamed protein product, partial [Ectocarpus sp. 8 AP-2014]
EEVAPRQRQNRQGCQGDCAGMYASVCATGGPVPSRLSSRGFLGGVRKVMTFSVDVEHLYLTNDCFCQLSRNMAETSPTRSESPPEPWKIGSVSIHRRAERTFLDGRKAHLVASLILLQASISPLALENVCIAVCGPQKL